MFDFNKNMRNNIFILYLNMINIKCNRVFKDWNLVENKYKLNNWFYKEI